MVLYLQKWTIRSEKREAYGAWAPSAIQRTLAVPGVVEFRAYRPATGEAEVAVAYEFADMAAWAAWYSRPCPPSPCRDPSPSPMR